MQSISIQIVFVLLFQGLFIVKVDLRECGEFHPGFDYKPPSYQDDSEQLLNFTDDNNSGSQMENMLKLLNNDEKDEYLMSYSDNIIKYVPDRIKAEGYPAEMHEVTTDDGYILQLHRIPYGIKSKESNQTRPPVLIMHALLESSNSFIALGPNNSLAYLLADAGYDVWLGNARGSEPSRGHIRLPSTGWRQKQYWQFSWHEIGIYDLPAMIDFILSKTHRKQLNYIGYSQGTTAFFVMMSERPEFNAKIIEAQLMAPAATMKLSTFPLVKVFYPKYKLLKRTFNILGIYKFTLKSKLALKFFGTACKNLKGSTPVACKQLLTRFLDSDQINCTSLPSIMVNTPSGSSIRTIFHYFQIMKSGEFTKFDYENKRLNREKYGSDTPPLYNLTQVTTPVNLYYSKDDTLVLVDGVLELKTKLRSIKSSYEVPVAGFTHLDFAYSRYVRKALNEKLISYMNKANNK